MPLHKIPLCSFNYVGETLSSATFKYDISENINKNQAKLFYKKERKEITKLDNRLAYSNDIKINKNMKSKEVINTNTEIYTGTRKELNKSYSGINKNDYIKLNNACKDICKHEGKNINVIDNYLCKSRENYLGSIIKKIEKETKIFLSKGNLIVDVKGYKNIVASRTNRLDKNIEMQVEISNFSEILKNNTMLNISNVNSDKEIKIFHSINLDKYKYKKLDKILNKDFDIINELDLSLSNFSWLKRNDLSNLDIEKNRAIEINNLRQMALINMSCNVVRYNIKKLDLIDNYYIDKKAIEQIDKNINSYLMYKTNNLILSKYRYLTLARYNNKNILRYLDDRLFYISKPRIMGKMQSLGLTKDIKRNIFVDLRRKLDREVNIRIFKEHTAHLNRATIKEIYNTTFYKKLTTFEINMCIEIMARCLNKPTIDVYIPYKSKALNKPNIDIYMPYKLKGLELIKRWWVLGAAGLLDPKVLPQDYKYINKPLWINRRDREYGKYLKELKEHPISFMPYLENKGVDLDYGLEEMALSIEIMIDMVNIVGMIVHHGSSQFINASGQESIEFIMELLIEWLNLDSTVQEMNNKGSREHYLRCYRWIRWEAEKVWFMADKDHSQDRMAGLKYAGMLLASLIDYMKYHHFNLVPIYHNLKNLDIERTLFNTSVITDKSKGKRHYYIENKIFGGR